MKEKIGWLMDFVEVKKMTIISNIWMKIPIRSKLAITIEFPEINYVYRSTKKQLTLISPHPQRIQILRPLSFRNILLWRNHFMKISGSSGGKNRNQISSNTIED